MEDDMGDRANIYLEMPGKDGEPDGIYLYTHYYGHKWPEMLRQALEFGRGRWTDDQYLARIITSQVFSDIQNDETGGGLSLRIGDNEHLVTVCDLIGREVSFATEGGERDAWARRGHMPFADYVSQSRADYPPESSDD